MRFIIYLCLLLSQPVIYAQEMTPKEIQHKFATCVVIENLDCMKEMIELGADYKAYVGTGKAALHHAAFNFNDGFKALKYLLDLDSSYEHLSIRTKNNGLTPLHLLIADTASAKGTELLIAAAGDNISKLLKIKTTTLSQLTAIESIVRDRGGAKHLTLFINAITDQRDLIYGESSELQSPFGLSLLQINPTNAVAIFSQLKPEFKVEAVAYCHKHFPDRPNLCNFLEQSISKNVNQDLEGYL